MTCGVCGHEQDRGRFCGRCGARTAAQPRADAPPTDAAPARPRTGTPDVEREGDRAGARTHGPLLALVLALVAVLAVVSLLDRDTPLEDDTVVASPLSPAPAAPPASGGGDGSLARGPIGFREATGAALVFDDGEDGTLAVDLDTGAQVRSPAGPPRDQPSGLREVGGWLVVGGEDTFAVAPGPGRPFRWSGGARLVLPAAEPDRLWLIHDDGGDGGAPGPADGLGTWTLVDASGATIAAIDVPAGDLRPIRGVPGGLAVRGPDGSLLKYDLEQGRLVDYVGDGSAWIADVTADRVVWCDDPCGALTVSTGDGVVVATLGSGETFHQDGAWIAGDGGQLAAAVTIDLGISFDHRLRVYSVGTGDVLADTQILPGASYGDWSQSGAQFFSWLTFAGGGAGAPAVLSRWAGGDTIEKIHVADRGIRDVYDFVVLPVDAAAELFGASPGGRIGSSQQGAR